MTGVAGFGTAGVLRGGVRLSGDSAIEFASGEITGLKDGSSLSLSGNDAVLEDSTALGSNSALTGLANVAGSLTLERGASLSTTGALTNSGYLNLDSTTGAGSSTLSIAGGLTNTGYLNVNVGGGTASALQSNVSTTALTNTGSISLGYDADITATSLDNTGQLSLSGYAPGYPDLIDVTTGVAGFGTAGVLTGNVDLESSVIEFLSGQISTIATGASLELFDGSFVEDSTALGSNSALTGLSNVSGTLKMGSGSSSGSASLSTTGALTNSGLISLGTSGRGTLSVAGALTNTGKLDIGSASVTANSFVNSATVNLSGALNVSGATTNNGSISIASDTEALAGAVGGAGSFSLSNANLQFDASVSAGQTISESGADALTLEQAQKFAATISGFGTGDTIDATNFVETGTTYNFVENSAMTGGTLTLTDTSLSLTANILMTGHYSNSSFTLVPDSGTGTLVKFA